MPKKSAKAKQKQAKKPKSRKPQEKAKKQEVPVAVPPKEPKQMKATKDASLDTLRSEAAKAKVTLEKATTEADALHRKADALAAAAKTAFLEAVRPYREACRKARVECEFGGQRAPNKTPAVRFLIEKVSGGVKLAIGGRPETEQLITNRSLKESVNKAAYAYTDRFLGSRQEIGAKGSGLGVRLRSLLKQS